MQNEGKLPCLLESLVSIRKWPNLASDVSSGNCVAVGTGGHRRAGMYKDD